MFSGKIVPCDVGDRSQSWVLKVRKSGLVALHPVEDGSKNLETLVKRVITTLGKS